MALSAFNRREFLFSSLAFSTLAAHGASASTSQPPRFAHRQANMVTAPGQSVFDLARSIHGLSGVELQMIWKGKDYSDPESVRAYKTKAAHSGIQIPSIAGVWKKGENIFDATVAENALIRAIRMCEGLGAKVILVALYKQNCPDMSSESSFAPVVRLLQKMGARAKDANVTFGLETSLLPPDEKKLLDLVDIPTIRSYYDAVNVAYYHPGAGLDGIELLGHRIVQCHLKNEDRLLGQQPSRVDWVAALKAFRQIGYAGWYVFETKHASPERCVADTEANIQFVRQQLKAAG